MLDAVGLRHTLAAGNGARGQKGDDNGRGETHYYGDGVQGGRVCFPGFCWKFELWSGECNCTREKYEMFKSKLGAINNALCW